MIDPSIANMNVPNVGNAINIYNNALRTNEQLARSQQQRQQSEQLFPLQMKLTQGKVDAIPTNQAFLEARTEGAQMGNDASRDQMRFKSIHQTASIISPLLRQGNVDAAKNFLRQNIAKFDADPNTDSVESREALAMLEAGNVQGAIAITDQILAMGGNRADPTANQKDFQTYQNLQGQDKADFGVMIGATPKPQAVKTAVVQTPTGATVIDERTGETIKVLEDPAKKAEFEAKQQERKVALRKKKEEEKRAIEKVKIQKIDAAESRKNALSTSLRAFELTKELADKDKIASVTGWWDTLTPTLSGESQDVINKALELKDLLTLDNLKLMTGVLTDRDIQILARAGSGLNVDEDGFLGSEKGVVNQINKVQRILTKKLEASVGRGDLAQEDYAQIISGTLPGSGETYSDLWGD